ncbi:DUF1015 domain-containing protein [Flavobacteriaceae bacterium S356]|uniref:DUF1015 domain-containing protein n=1 Tax=Asprobacillus argus TaxID=3076534 RepID=A0ABU3LDH6_9FLAO|nr:DUF1015 domain-containing protein [Flavobacteriaceae bacterium S356]
MAIVKPFKAIRPSRDKVALVSSKSYEAYSPAELGAKLDFNPFTFLHIINPGYKYHQEITGEQRFEMVHNRYEEFKENDIFIQDSLPSFYLYESSDVNNTFCGIIAATSVDDYNKGIIKKHEGTMQHREELFENYLKVTGFNAEPVLLTHKDNSDLDAIIAKKKLDRPEYEFSTTDKKLHKLWVIFEESIIASIIDVFKDTSSLYIADGHHRSASSALLAKHLTDDNEHNTGDEPYHFFMSYLIPESHLKISEFNRFVKDLNGYSADEFLVQLDAHFRIENRGQQMYKPSKKHHFSMYLNGEFYSLYLRKGSYHFTDALSTLDAEILFQTILKPILGIHDLNNNNRLGYTNNTLDSLSLKTNVDNGTFKVGFGLIPITVQEMKEIADAELKMPPKTSYIEPKLRSGLTMYEF